MLDMALLAEEMAAIVDDAVERATRPWIDRVAALEADRTANALTDEAKSSLLADWIAHLATLPKPADGKSVTVEDVQPVIDSAVAAAVARLPAAEPGKSVDLNQVREMVQEAVAAIPVPADGSSVTAEEVRPLIADEVQRAVAALPPAQPGAPADPEETRKMVSDAVANLPKPADGKSVTVEDIEPLLADLIERAVDAIPKAKDGVGLAGALIDRAGNLVVTLTDGTTRPLGPVVGRDYEQAALEQAVADAVSLIPAPEPGKPGESVEPAVVKQMVDEAVALIPSPETPYVGQARGLYDPTALYRAMDVVSFNGCEWRAKVDKPGEMPGADWMLSAQRGKPGKPADPAKPPAMPSEVIAGYLDERGLAIILTKDNGDEIKVDLSALAATDRAI